MQSERLAVPVNEFAQYVKKHVLFGFFLAAGILLAYGKQAFSTDFYIDAEVFLNNPYTFYNWGGIGRFGLIALKYLLGNTRYNPYFEAVLFLSALWLLGMAGSCLFGLFYPKMSGFASFIFAGIFLSFPTYADQFMFRFQSFEIVFAMLLIVFATRYFYLFIKEKDYAAYALAAAFDVFSFGIYQSMVNLQICFYIAIYLFLISGGNKEERVHFARAAIINFLLTFAIYELIAKLFFSSGDYLSSQAGWLSGDIASVIFNLLAYIKRVLLALDVFYPITYPCCVLLSFAFLVWAFACDRKRFAPYMLGIGALLASPFFLAIAIGAPLPYRAQCMLAFVCAFAWLFSARHLQGRGGCKYALCVIIGTLFILCQSAVIMRMFYTQDVIRDSDKITAAQLMAKLDDTGAKNGKPVVFLGHMDAKINASCYTKWEAGSYLSYSVYEFAYIEGVPVDTPNYFNTTRILGYFKAMGFDYAEPSAELTQAVKAYGDDMASFPDEACVRETSECVIVKLSD